MKVGIFTSPVDDNMTAGQSTYIRGLCKQLLKLVKDDEEIYFLHHTRTDDELYRQGNEIIVPRQALRRELFLRSTDLDIIHYQSVKTLSTPFCILNGKINVTTVHDASGLEYPLNTTLKHYVALKYLWPIILRAFTKIITVSNDSSKRLQKWFKLRPGRVVAIYNGVDPMFQILSESGSRARLASKYGVRSRFILHVNKFMPRKNPRVLIDAFASLRQKNGNYKLVIIGKGWENELVEGLLDRHNLQDHVQRLGWIPYEDVPLFFNVADVYLYPSLYEGFGLSIIEAMACGCPVVSSNVAAIPEIAGDAALLAKDPTNSDEFADLLIQSLENDLLREEMITKGVQRAKLFSWRTNAEETLAMYRELSSKRI